MAESASQRRRGTHCPGAWIPMRFACGNPRNGSIFRKGCPDRVDLEGNGWLAFFSAPLFLNKSAGNASLVIDPLANVLDPLANLTTQSVRQVVNPFVRLDSHLLLSDWDGNIEKPQPNVPPFPVPHILPYFKQNNNKNRSKSNRINNRNVGKARTSPVWILWQNLQNTKRCHSTHQLVRFLQRGTEIGSQQQETPSRGTRTNSRGGLWIHEVCVYKNSKKNKP